MDDLISRQAAIDALKICDRNEDGINCHLCPLRDKRWDGAWEDDETNCYEKLMKDAAILLEQTPSAQPEYIEQIKWERDIALQQLKELGYSLGEKIHTDTDTDTISRQAAIDALAEDIPSAYTPDGSHPADEGIFMAQEIYADCIQTLKGLPSVHPEIIRCQDCKWWGCDDEDGVVRVCHAAKHGHMSRNWSIMIYRTHKGDFYCADAERREIINGCEYK